MNTKRLLTFVFILVICITSMVVPAAAAEKGVDVRVNGQLVDFPDQKPIVNSDNRTLIPVRFVAEELGADVKWNGLNSSATIKKDGITIVLPIGSKEMKVTDASGKTTTVTMDTEAVIMNGRTMVPIRFVAEALGAFVDYSDTYQTVGIYLDILTAEQIEELRSYKYTSPKNAGYTYEEAKTSGEYNKEQMASMYGTVRDSFGVFANSHEYLYRYSPYARLGTEYRFNSLNVTKKVAGAEEFYDMVLQEAMSTINYSSQNVTIKFIADNSSIYHSDCLNGMYTTVRGYITATVHGSWRNFTSEDNLAFAHVGGFSEAGLVGVTQAYVADVHMYTGDGVILNTIVPLTDITR